MVEKKGKKCQGGTDPNHEKEKMPRWDSIFNHEKEKMPRRDTSQITNGKMCRTKSATTTTRRKEGCLQRGDNEQMAATTRPKGPFS